MEAETSSEDHTSNCYQEDLSVLTLVLSCLYCLLLKCLLHSDISQLQGEHVGSTAETTTMQHLSPAIKGLTCLVIRCTDATHPG